MGSFTMTKNFEAVVEEDNGLITSVDMSSHIESQTEASANAKESAEASGSGSAEAKISSKSKEKIVMRTLKKSILRKIDFFNFLKTKTIINSVPIP